MGQVSYARAQTYRHTHISACTCTYARAPPGLRADLTRDGPTGVQLSFQFVPLRACNGRIREERKLHFQNFLLSGLPPKDLWEDISQLWLRAGINVDDAWKRACSVTNEWVYEPGPGPLRSRIRQRVNRERSIPLKNRSSALNATPSYPFARPCLSLGRAFFSSPPKLPNGLQDARGDTGSAARGLRRDQEAAGISGGKTPHWQRLCG